MVNRIYVEKREGYDHEARALREELTGFLGIKGLTKVRVLNCYDVEDLDDALFARAVDGIFSEPQTDDVTTALPTDADYTIATEYLPGQFDQRADSAAQCIQLMARCDRPAVRTATVYLLYGDITEETKNKVRGHIINPVEKREASLEPVDTLKVIYDLPQTVPTLNGFTKMGEEELFGLIDTYALAMDRADIAFTQKYFAGIDRDPTLTELRMLDTYWSDHCRHTTFLTELTDVTFEDADVAAAYARYMDMRKELGRTKPVTLMDIGTIGAKVLKARGVLTDLDESEEINACTIKCKVKFGAEEEDWLFLFKNETHNHPTEIEPFGGAATCIGGAIRDPLSGRSYVYQAMRVTGAADPTQPIENTIPGKLPQRRLVTTAAAGYSSYGNQIGLATGLVEEIYHPGYAAKRMEIGAVVGAAPAKNVRRETPAPGDIVLLMGGRTGRDGCGGATGSSKSHNAQSLTTCGAEVQKGNAPEERKLQRLFRDEEAARMIKRCNDFGAGGVSVAIGELADGLEINLNAVPRKYDGLDGTELAISESQERMAVVLAPEDVEAFEAIAARENLECTRVAVVTEEPKLVMHWNGATIVDVERSFLNSNGAPKYTKAHVDACTAKTEAPEKGFAETMRETVSDLNQCAQRGLAERFDATNGAASLLMPFGGSRQLTPTQVMASRFSVRGRESDTASVMAYGFDPYVTEENPYKGAYLAVVHSIAKLAAAGADTSNVHLTFQEYFERMTREPSVWGKPLSALLGALDAQVDFGAAAIGGKDSMSGTFEKMHVPPTLVSFAVSVCDADTIRGNEFKKAGSFIDLIVPEKKENGLPCAKSVQKNFASLKEMFANGTALSAYAVGRGGAAAAAFKMAVGNGFGVKFDASAKDLFANEVGALLVETTVRSANTIGVVTQDGSFGIEGGESVPMSTLEDLWQGKLEKVFPTNSGKSYKEPTVFTYGTKSRKTASVKVAKPHVLIPVFPGTNCEYDTERAFLAAGADPEIMVVRNLTAADVEASAEAFAKKIASSQIIFIPGGFSGGDEPDGSGKFITSFFRNPAITDAVHALLNTRDGLIGGICNGFQALVKLGLVPYGEIRAAKDCEATLTFNDIGRHQSRLIRARVASNMSPWLMYTKPGDVYTCPISHGEGKFIAPKALVQKMAQNGQIATQYCDNSGNPTMDILFNPNGSVDAIEGITSPDGRVFGKMGHSERVGQNRALYVNVDGNYDIGMFRAATDYFTK